MKISVIVPLYNGERYLRETLAAILDQSHEAADIHVVDDGSSDEGPAIARSFGERITVHSPGHNGGVQAARNLGLAAASGDWIATCDQDDIWGRDYLRSASTLHAAEPRLDFIFSNFRMTRAGVPDDATKLDAAPPGWWEEAGRRDLPEGMVFDRPIAGLTFRWTPIFPSAALASRALVDRAGPYDVAMRGLRPEDWEWTLRCLYVAFAGALREPLVTIRRHDANFSRDQCRCLIDEVALLRFVRERHAPAAPFKADIDAQIRMRRIMAADLAFAERNHALARQLYAEVDDDSRSLKLWMKAACANLPDRFGLPLNHVLQRVSEGWRARRRRA